MGLIVDKTLDDGLLDESKAQGICKYCGQTVILSTNKFEETCPYCGANIIIDEVVDDNSITINLDDM